MNAVVPRKTIEQICASRDEALRLYDIAFDKIQEADAAVSRARAEWVAASPGRMGEWSSSAEEIKNFLSAVKIPNREEYRRTARRLIDTTIWAYVIHMAGIEALMDSQAKEELRQQMRYVPERTNSAGQLINQEEMDRSLPPVSVENIIATLERFRADAELIFRRGIVNVFSKLDRRFRSHDGFKIGSRIIINGLINSYGMFESHGGRSDTLRDVERTFLIIDGKDPRESYGSIVDVVKKQRGSNWSTRQSEHEGDYFKVRIFKNGNAHLWFTNKDLVEKVNKILADHYGEVIGDGMTKEADPLQDKKLTPARRYGFFPTPDAAAKAVIEKARVRVSAESEQLRVLEPSAGTGNLARLCAPKFEASEWGYEPERYRALYRWDNLVDCIEIQPALAAALRDDGLYNRVTCADFHAIKPNPNRLYDRVVMNPPFDRERDIDHVVHALNFLKPSGILVSIMSAGVEFRETRKSIAFRNLMEKMNADWTDLPPGSFAETGTYVNTVILRVCKDGSRIQWR